MAVLFCLLPVWRLSMGSEVAGACLSFVELIKSDVLSLHWIDNLALRGWCQAGNHMRLRWSGA
jgi:hypothetical protein